VLPQRFRVVLSGQQGSISKSDFLDDSKLHESKQTDQATPQSALAAAIC
jgi:hypothetical protein